MSTTTTATCDEAPGRPPRRIQRRRTAGWRMPAGALNVGRPTRFGNPFPVAEHGPAGAVALYRAWLANQPDLLTAISTQLHSRDLACWCPLDQPCHADVLLQQAGNGATAAGGPLPLSEPGAVDAYEQDGTLRTLRGAA